MTGDGSLSHLFIAKNQKYLIKFNKIKVTMKKLFVLGIALFFLFINPWNYFSYRTIAR